MGYPLSIDLRVRILAADRLLLSDPGSILEQLLSRKIAWGFPYRVRGDSRCLQAKEAGMHRVKVISLDLCTRRSGG
ncbi:hypothetical protein Apmu_0038_02 [Acidiphilium multivorum AIU301]|jgi:hypothetical protein|nr:hypothetical protein Apmu_0038_02 [Acidiphilium multivorum AIU301]